MIRPICSRLFSRCWNKALSYTTPLPASPLLPSTLAKLIFVAGLTLAITIDAFNSILFSFARAHMMGDLQATPDEISWLNTVFLAVKLAFFPVAAWLVDRFGVRPLFIAAFASLCLTSLATLQMPSLETFIGIRILQGAFGACLLVAAHHLLFQRAFLEKNQGMFQSIFALGAVMAPTSLCPFILGWLVEEASWAEITKINLLLCFTSLALLFSVRGYFDRFDHQSRRFDWVGYGLLTIAIFLITYLLLEGPRWNWFDDPHIRWLSLLALLICAFFLFRTLFFRPQNSLYSAGLFANDNFSLGFFVSFIAGFALFGTAFLIPVFSMQVLQNPVNETGWLLAPSIFSVGGALLCAGALMRLPCFNPLKLVPLGILLFMIAMGILSGSNSSSGAPDLMPALIIRGAGLGFLFLAITAITLFSLAPRHLASGIALFNFGRQMGGIIGISFLQTHLNIHNAQHRQILTEHLNPANPAFQNAQERLSDLLASKGLDPLVSLKAAARILQSEIQQQAGLLSFNEAFLTIILFFLLAMPCALSLKLFLKRKASKR